MKNLRRISFENWCITILTICGIATASATSASLYHQLTQQTELELRVKALEKTSKYKDILLEKWMPENIRKLIK